MRRLACALAVGMVMPPVEAAALRDLRAGAFWQRLTELDLLPDLGQHRLAILQDCPSLKPQVNDLSAAWLEILDLSATDVQEWVMALAKLGVIPPEVGYEILNAGGRVLAEAELAWPGQQAAVLLTGSETEAHAFRSQGWRIYLADGSPLPAALKSLLMENLS